MTYENALEILKKYGQEHVLAYYDELNDEEKQSLLLQIGEIDFSMFDVLKEKGTAGKTGSITPTAALTLDKNTNSLTRYLARRRSRKDSSLLLCLPEVREPDLDLMGRRAHTISD